MKAARSFGFVAATLVVGFLALRWCIAQPASPPSREGAKFDHAFGLHALESFVLYLQGTKQTNVLNRFSEYSNASLVSRHYADLGVTVAILQRLRDGRTNEAIELLEGRVSTGIIGFAASYRELPNASREKINLKLLEFARDYRSKYPFKHRHPNIDEGVTDALRILEKDTSK